MDSREYAVNKDDDGAVSVIRQIPPQKHKKKESKYRLLTFIVLSLFLFLTISSTLQFKDSLLNALFPKPPSNAQTSGNLSTFLSNELLIKFKKEYLSQIKENPQDTGIGSVNDIFARENISQFVRVAKKAQNSRTDAEIFSWYKISLPSVRKEVTGKFDSYSGAILSEDGIIRNLQILASRLQKDPSVEKIQPNFVYHTTLVPNDPYYNSSGSWGQAYPDLWGMKIIGTNAAWNISTGSVSIIVADIDTGVDRNHPDLKNNIWVNAKEIPNNTIDDDNNGYVDDDYGWDFVSSDGDPMDDHGHGTHTAGTIGAVGNNSVGVVGINWKVSIMSLKGLDNNGSGHSDKLADALRYAADMGAKVSSNSWGGYGQDGLLDGAVGYEHDAGMVVVVSAGNSRADALDFSPASSDDAITVSASDYQDNFASDFSNFGEKIEVAAPGVDVLSTRSSQDTICSDKIVGSYYCRLSGTSMAAPHVAGLAALLLSKNPNLTNEQVRQLIRIHADDKGAFGKDPQFGYGRINAANTLAAYNTIPLTPRISDPDSRERVKGLTFDVYGSADGQGFKNYTVQIGQGRTPANWTTVASSSTPVTNGKLASGIDIKTMIEGNNIIRLTSFDQNGKQYQYQVHDVLVDNIKAAITSPYYAVPKGITNIIGSASVISGYSFGSYKLEWGSGRTPTSWSTQGIALTNNGTQPVSNATLGTWDTSGLSVGDYVLRLTVASGYGMSEIVDSQLKLDPDLIKGWPKQFDVLCKWCDSMPIFADLENDGKKEIIYGAPDGKLYVFDRFGNIRAGFPISFIASGGYLGSTVNVFDLDNNSTKEIIVSVDFLTSDKIYIVKNDGSFYPGWPMPSLKMFRNDTCCSPDDRTPTVADLDNDGVYELVALDGDPWSNTGFIHAFHVNGSELSGFPKQLTLPDGFNVRMPVSVADMDGDGKKEIAFGSKNKLYLLNNTGSLLPNWPVDVKALGSGTKISFTLSGVLSFADMLGDGKLELVGLSQYLADENFHYELYVLKKDGTSLPNFPQKMTQYVLWETVFDSAAVADLDKDGKDEVIVGNRGINIYGSGGIEFSDPSQYVGVPQSVALSDIDGDGKLEFSQVERKSSYALEIMDDNPGSTYWAKNFWTGFDDTTPRPRHTMIFADLDNNGRMETAATTYPLMEPFNLVYLWEIPTTNPSKYEWPMPWYDPARTGRVLISNPTPTPTLSISRTPTPTPTRTPTPTATRTPTPVSDTTPPTVSITSPTAAYVKGIISVTASATDNSGGSGIAGVQFLLDGANLQAEDTVFPYSILWNTTNTTNGLHILKARARDKAGNKTTSTGKSVIVDNNPPVISVTAPLTARKGTTITISASATDNVAMSSVSLSFNGSVLCSSSASPYSCSASKFIPSTTTTNTYSGSATAYDKAGNTSTKSFSVYIY